MAYDIRFSRRAKKDADSLSPKLKYKLRDILTQILTQNPYVGKRLIGDLSGSFSYRPSFKDRVVYSIDKKSKTVFIE